MTEKRNSKSSQTQDIVTAAALVIGDEILSGRTRDINIGTIADHLTEIGIRLCEVRIVPDEEVEIIEAVNALRTRYDYVFTTGGIGPTHDDITADCIAKVFDATIDIDPRAVAMMRKRYSEEQMTPARLRMTRIPSGAELIDNPISQAPGFFIDNVIVMAGIPKIMEAMLHAVTPSLRTGAKMLSVSIHVAAPEGTISPYLSETQTEFPDVKMGSYPYMANGQLGVYLVLRAVDTERLEKACAGLVARLGALGVVHERKTPDL